MLAWAISIHKVSPYTFVKWNVVDGSSAVVIAIVIVIVVTRNDDSSVRSLLQSHV